MILKPYIHKILFTLVYVLGSNVISLGQYVEPIFYELNDILPSNEVYDLYLDESNYLWITSDQGIVKFDGENIQIIDAFKHTKIIYNFFEETKHKIWVSTNNNELFWFNPLKTPIKFIPYTYNLKLKNEINKFENRQYINSIKFINNELFVTFLNSVGYININNQGHVKTNFGLSQHNYYKPKLNFLLNFKNEKYYTVFYKDETEQNKFYIYLDNHKKIKIENNISMTGYDNLGTTETVNTINGKLISTGKHLFYHTHDTLLYKKLNAHIFCIDVLKNNIFVGTKKGIYQFDHHLNLEKIYLNNYSITSIINDKKNGLWISTLEKGVFYIKNININLIKESRVLNITYVNLKNDTLLLINNNNELYYFTNKLIKTKESIYKKNNIIRSSSNKLHAFFFIFDSTKTDFGDQIYDYSLSNYDNIFHVTGKYMQIKLKNSLS